MRNQFIMDPILIDLSTGEMFLTATYPSKVMREEGAGAVTTAIFSADGRYFYYTLYGRFENGIIRLYRYDLNSGETDLCFETDKKIYYPCMSELSDGSLLFLEDTIEKDGHEGIVIARYINGEWTLSVYPIKLDRSYFYTRTIRYSPNSRYICLLGGNTSGATPIIQIIDPDNVSDHLNRLILLAKDEDEIVILSPDEYQRLIDSDDDGKQGIANYSIMYPYQMIYNAVFSPDGHYLLVKSLCTSVESGRTQNLYLIRLDDFSIRKVEGLDAEKILSGIMGRDYPINIEWNSDEIIVGTEDGIKTYTFE